MNSNKDIPRMKTPVFCTFKYWNDRHEWRDIWVNRRLLLDTIDDAERVPKLASVSNFGLISYQTLNFVKVSEPCISCKVGLSICPSYLRVDGKFKEIIYM